MDWLTIDGIKLEPGRDSEEERLRMAAKRLSCRPEDISSMAILRRSVDARKKPEVFFVYRLGVKLRSGVRIEKRRHGISRRKTTVYRIPKAGDPKLRTVVVGAGPAGLFCALVLAMAGCRPLVVERGRRMEERHADVERFFQTGSLDPESNVQFGEGGAGAFSDGKLNSGVKDRDGRRAFILETFAGCGADPAICYDAKPHIGTDRLRTVIPALRDKIIGLGGEFRFGQRVDGLCESGGRITGVRLQDGSKLSAEAVVLAIGHSARDTYEMLIRAGIPMTAKPFAVGLRIEHPQEMIDLSQYGRRRDGNLFPAAYQLTAKINQRPAYTFCMCPGGYVLNASSEPGRLCVNGMSNALRDGENANSAVVCAVGGEQFDLTDPRASIRYQRELERRAFELAGGKIPQQLYSDFCQNATGSAYGSFESAHRGQAQFANLREIFDEQTGAVLQEAVAEMGRRLAGFDRPDAILSGVESRTSAPVRITRDRTALCARPGLYPCGEGAGYAGGIMSAAMDGMRIAEAICESRGQKGRNAYAFQ